MRERLRLLEAEDERTRRILWLQTEVEKGFSGATTPWTSKNPERIRKLISWRALRKS